MAARTNGIAKQEEGTYTYRGGKKVALTKRSDQFVVREMPEALPPAMGLAERVSSSSTRVTCDPQDLEPLMRAAREIAPTHHAYQRADTALDFLVTDRLLVTFHRAPSVGELGAFLAKYALQILERYSEREFLLRLTDQTGQNPVKLVVQLTEQEGKLLETVDHDLNVKAAKAAVSLPTDPAYARQWHLHQRAAASADYDARCSARCEQAWLFLDSLGSDEVVIGITDDGCQIDHPDFDSSGKFSSWGYFQGPSLVHPGVPGATASGMYQTGANHGTSCAGVIGAEVDGLMTVGAAPGVKLLPIKWESDDTGLFISDSKLRTALDYMADRVDVVSNSWGITPISSWSAPVINRIRELARTGGRRGKGIVFLWAAGNENCPISLTTNVDVPYTHGWNGTGTSWIGVQTARVFSNSLVGIEGVMHIAALGSTAQRSHYSNYGTGIDLSAPSSNSHGYWRLQLLGRGITTTSGTGRVVDSFGGTSSATPLVAAVAGLVISANPQLTGPEVISILKRTASKDLNQTAWPRTPPAPFDLQPAWDISPVAPFHQGAFQNTGLVDGTWSPWFGHGRVDAEAAVRMARELAGQQTSRVSITSVAELAIPDNQPAGIASRMAVQQQGLIQSLRVFVDIAHPYIGDLVVRLVSPAGLSAYLHQRTGASSDNIIRTFTEAELADLQVFRGSNIHGVWSLELTDAAVRDEGRLRQWRLEADIVQDGALRLESLPGRSIPDDDQAGITDAIAVGQDRVINDLSVDLDITHSFVGDLRVELRAPSGASAVLHNRGGNSADDIRRSFRANDVQALGALRGERSGGTWVLSVADLAGQDVGKLNRWALTIA